MSTDAKIDHRRAASLRQSQQEVVKFAVTARTGPGSLGTSMTVDRFVRGEDSRIHTESRKWKLDEKELRWRWVSKQLADAQQTLARCSCNR